jgi:hypothetical protein
VFLVAAAAVLRYSCEAAAAAAVLAESARAVQRMYISCTTTQYCLEGHDTCDHAVTRVGKREGEGVHLCAFYVR